MKKDVKLVYTSDPEEAKRLREQAAASVRSDAPPASQTIRVQIDRKRRGGKTVTVASGFNLSDSTIESLARDLKKKCGAGGTAKDGEIEIQGERVDAIKGELLKRGFRVK